jgi:hypothetical protein
LMRVRPSAAARAGCLCGMKKHTYRDPQTTRSMWPLSHHCLPIQPLSHHCLPIQPTPCSSLTVCPFNPHRAALSLSAHSTHTVQLSHCLPIQPTPCSSLVTSLSAHSTHTVQLSHVIPNHPKTPLHWTIAASAHSKAECTARGHQLAKDRCAHVANRQADHRPTTGNDVGPRTIGWEGRRREAITKHHWGHDHARSACAWETTSTYMRSPSLYLPSITCHPSPLWPPACFRYRANTLIANKHPMQRSHDSVVLWPATLPTETGQQ